MSTYGHVQSYMDQSMAFDCLPHDLLIVKLQEYGLLSETFKLLSSYLTNRGKRLGWDPSPANGRKFLKVSLRAQF